MERKKPQGNLCFHKNTQIMGFGLVKNVFGIKMGVPRPYDMDTFLHDISTGYFINKIGIPNCLSVVYSTRVGEAMCPYW